MCSATWRASAEAQRLDLAGKVGEVPRQYCREDALERCRGEVGQPQLIVVPHVARRHVVASATRRTHGCHKLDIDNLAECELLEVVPATMVHPLPHQLDRRLGAVLLRLRHVEVVDEDDRFLPEGRAEDAFASLVELRVNYALRDARRRLCREGEHDGLKRLSRQPVEQPILEQHRLASARVAAQQKRHAMAQQRVGHVPDLGRVDVDHHIVDRLALGKELRRLDVARRPRGGRQDRLRRARCGELIWQLLPKEGAQEGVEASAAIGVNGGADAPHEREEELADKNVG
eukprot:scaffold10193_cov107-Isochrysis_galbana.AAC.5